MEPLATTGELETHLSRTLDADRAEHLLTLASGVVRAYCGWDLARETTTFHVYSDGGSLLTLPTLYLLAVDEVRVRGVVVDTEKWPYSYSRKGQMWGSWVPGVEYEVDVVHGYEPIPDLIKLVTLDLAARALSNPEGLSSATVGQVSKTWAKGSTNSGMSELHQRLLDRYSL